jgi:hypothetical protein
MEQKHQTRIYDILLLLLVVGLALGLFAFYEEGERADLCSAIGGEMLVINYTPRCVIVDTLPLCVDKGGRVKIMPLPVGFTPNLSNLTGE